MTDPLRPRDREEPRRATPLQPDKPGSGRRQEHAGEQPGAGTDGDRSRDADARARERETNAVDNVREGYK